MRQGQQNRRGRGRGSSSGGGSGGNSTNNNRKGQNPLSRNYESNGPDVKIRGTASQIAEKYSTLARDASSSSDTVMAENYLQHAEHYNRIIMAAQTQSMQPVAHNDSEAGQAMNGVHRATRDANGAMRDQAQPETNVPSPQDTQPQPATASDQSSDDQPSVDDQPMTEQAASTESKKDAAGDDANGEAEPGRRRRRRYPGSNGAGRSAAAESDGGTEKTADAASDGHPSDEVTA